jgi:hypothetical protein
MKPKPEPETETTFEQPAEAVEAVEYETGEDLPPDEHGTERRDLAEEADAEPTPAEVARDESRDPPMTTTGPTKTTTRSMTSSTQTTSPLRRARGRGPEGPGTKGRRRSTPITPAPVPPQPRLPRHSGLTKAALRVLREEARREDEARRAEQAQALETQPELGLTEGEDTPDRRGVRAHVARMRGEDAERETTTPSPDRAATFCPTSNRSTQPSDPPRNTPKRPRSKTPLRSRHGIAGGSAGALR